MKKIISFILTIVISVCLTSCYQDIEESSLEDYIVCINQNKCGHSSHSIDSPKNFLPSISFLEDYEYLEGTYFWREDDPFRGFFTANGVFPEIALLSLKYDENTYYKAKQTMLEEIQPYNDKFYQYNDYYFYENSNQINLDPDQTSTFPESFNMACYNDENYTLIFIGLYSGTLAGPSCLEDKYLEDIEGNWEAFVDQYFGAHYDFSK